MSIHTDGGINLDPAEIAKGLRSGLIKLTPADDVLRTPVVNAYLRQVESILADEFDRKAGLTSSSPTDQ